MRVTNICNNEIVHSNKTISAQGKHLPSLPCLLLSKGLEQVKLDSISEGLHCRQVFADAKSSCSCLGVLKVPGLRAAGCMHASYTVMTCSAGTSLLKGRPVTYRWTGGIHEHLPLIRCSTHARIAPVTPHTSAVHSSNASVSQCPKRPQTVCPSIGVCRFAY